MALTPQQKKFCLQNSADRIFQALISASSTISLDDLRQFAAERREFAPKLIGIEERFASMPSPEEVRDYENISSIADPRDLLAAMERYIHKWSDNQAAAEHVADIRNRYLMLKEAGDYDAIRCHTLDIATRTFAEKKENISVMEEYLDDYDHSGVAPIEHVTNVQHWLREAKENFEREIKQMWNSLFDENHRLKNLDDLKKFKGIIDNYESTTYSAQIDDVAWDWAMTEDDVMSALTEYEEFSEGLSRVDKIREVKELYHEWTLVDSSDMQAVIAFAHAHPDLPFSKEVSDTIRGLLNKEIEVINANPAGYSAAKFLNLYNTLDKDQQSSLLESIGADKELVDRLKKLGQVPLHPIPSLDVQSEAANGASQTDVLFFGTTNSGKTCVLTALFGNRRLNPDTADNWCGEYALALQSYGRYKIAPPHTTLGFVAVVDCKIKKQIKDREARGSVQSRRYGW